MASQQDVAARAHVSFMTVSRVVNNHPNVKKETRERVLAAIRELAYYPDASARALNTRKTENIGVIFPRKEYVFSRPFFIELCIELEDSLSRRGYHLFLGSTRTGDEYRDPTRLVKERKVDGLILIAPAVSDPEIERLAEANVPFVIVHGSSDAADCAYVDTDNAAGTAVILRYLFELGHRRIGFVCGNMSEINARVRYESYGSELKVMGIPFESDLVCTGDWSIESGYEAFRTLVRREPRPTAIVFSNDQMALGAIRAAYESKVRIPEDISITGYDDIKYAAFTVPALTTMRQPLDEVASAAAELILDRIAGGEGARGVVLSPELKVRSSCRRIG